MGRAMSRSPLRATAGSPSGRLAVTHACDRAHRTRPDSSGATGTGVVHMSVTDDDVVSNESGNPTLQEIVAARMSRRGVIVGAATIAGISSLLHAIPAGASARGNDRDDDERGRGPRRLLGFTSIPPSTADTVVVPAGYTARVLISWGDPVSDGPAFVADASNSAADQALQWGMHNDGVVYFPIRGSRTRASSSRTASTPTTSCCSRMVWRTGRRRRRPSRSTPTASTSSTSGKARPLQGVGGRPAIAVRPTDHRPDADRRSADRSARTPTRA